MTLIADASSMAPAHGGVVQPLSDLIPKEQSTGRMELVRTPFPARHEGREVTVTAVFERTAVVQSGGEKPRLATAAAVEVDPTRVTVMTPDEARRLVPSRRPRKPAPAPAIRRHRPAPVARLTPSEAELRWVGEEVESLAALAIDIEAALIDLRTGLAELRRRTAAWAAEEGAG